MDMSFNIFLGPFAVEMSPQWRQWSKGGARGVGLTMMVSGRPALQIYVAERGVDAARLLGLGKKHTNIAGQIQLPTGSELV